MQRVVIAAGTRVPGVGPLPAQGVPPGPGQPGFVHLLEEIARLGPADALIIDHPYYDTFTA
ncbi:hypothetical protein ACFQ0B_78915 [Nonomuraea thailandensis]